MREKISTHNDVLNELEKKWPGFKKEVKAKADKLHIAFKNCSGEFDIRQGRTLSHSEIKKKPLFK